MITLTTDFGTGSPYVAAMKGVILSINPAAKIVDLTHEIPPQDILQGAIALENVAPLFPLETIHVAVIDAGVGTDRAILYVEIGDQHYVCPDNGLLTRLASKTIPRKIIAITEEHWFRHPVSRTFHGRDIMAPVAAHLSRGIPPEQLGPAQDALVTIPPASDCPGGTPVPNHITGQVESIDSFGNLITNITRDQLAETPQDETVGVFCDSHETRGIFQAYADQPPMTLIALIGSNDHLELAIVNDSAKIMLGVNVGAAVDVRW